MLQLLKKITKSKKSLIVLMAVGVVALPAGAQVYANTTTEPQQVPVVAENITEQPIDDEVPLLVNETEVIVEEPVVTEDPNVELVVDEESMVEVNGPVTLEVAQVIAEAEHPESTVVASKEKTYNDEAVFAFYFTDDWKVFVRVSDGEVVKVKDGSEKDHACSNAYKQKYAAWKKAQSVRSDWRSSDRHQDRSYHREHRSDAARSSFQSSDRARWHQ